MILILLLTALGVASAVFAVALGLALRRRPAAPSLEGVALSAVTSFFDALGIGCFAPTTAYFKFRRRVPDELIPATMISGYALAAATEGFVFITSVQVDPLLLGLSIGASVAGAVLGVSVGARLPITPIRATMGLGLLIAAASFTLSNLGLMPHGGVATSLPPLAFALVVAASFVFGSLMNLGVGNFAPTLILVSLLGMDPRAAFPIMMGSAALLMVTSGARIVSARPLDLRLVLGMALGGIPAVLIAALVVKSLPLEWLRWGVVVVVTYAGAVMLRAAVARSPAAADPLSEEAGVKLPG
ncbi:sulfite exporter TauE/SafE family protein [Phenylobacterium sp.]|uniref:sulfite exporter TauE/SafE family protein n=1 Tax=Phenylobacterium sp. TaxID=1871053 RepID=UPI001226202D|nr:sulfite exporter TauE/SafE family protein [Phenylobacterium sp.]THD62180.1 MAG: sulfite exporter TauE/SafE family protein [Phenylobacterium sp.]